MNPPYPFPNSSFPCNPLNPNPNFDPNFSFHSHHQFNPSQAPSQSLTSDLPTSLSSLQNLLLQSQSTLDSLSSLLPLSLSSDSLVQCPSNPHHWVPPNSLFLHSLHCPSPLDVGPLLDTLHYPKTLKSEHQLLHHNKFVQPLQDPTSELCFSLDDYVDFDGNFFYRDCPGVVLTSSCEDTTNRIFSLPGVLSLECANFIGSIDGETTGFQATSSKVLPSELWLVGGEIEQWSEYPNGYSLCVLRALLCVVSLPECDLSMWVIANSPRFGVVIDPPMRDHMLVLFRLCLKPIVREASRSYDALLDRENGGQLNPKSTTFRCPVLVEVLRWLASLLSILYGESNAKSFIIAILKYVLPKAASHSSLFPVDMEIDGSSAIERETDSLRSEPLGKVTENVVDSRRDKRILDGNIFVYQIAAAIAALHERSLLEVRIKALRNPQQLTAYQRMAEHAYLSKKANEEREKRPDYRPVIEHDGLPNPRQQDQENNKAKTREELLAEERDYKRRRTSYRGKKLKRTTKEVMRDIIEEYMEAIKKAGGIGCLVKGVEEGATSTPETSHHHDPTGFKLNHNSSSNQQDGYRKLHNDYNVRDTTHFDASSSRNGQQEQDSYNRGHSKDRRRSSRDRIDRDRYSRSPSRDRGHGRSREHSSRRRNHDDMKMNKDDHSRCYYSSSNISRHYDHKFQHSRSGSLSISSGRKDKRKSESKDRQNKQRHENDESDSFGRNEVDDRYDPSEVCNIYDDFDDSKYTRPES